MRKYLRTCSARNNSLPLNRTVVFGCLRWGGVVWTRLPTCSSPRHLFLTVYPREQKPVQTFLNAHFLISEEFEELGESELCALNAELRVRVTCAHTKVIIRMMNGLSSGVYSIFFPWIEIPRRFFWIIKREVVLSLKPGSWLIGDPPPLLMQPDILTTTWGIGKYFDRSIPAAGKG